MKFLNKHYKKLEDVLRAAYHEKEKAEFELSSRWRMDLMRDIRRMGPLNETLSPFLFFNQFAWRFATVACMVALILSVYAGFTGFSPTDELTDMFLNDPVEFTLTQAFGE